MNIDTNQIINYFLYNLIIYVISQILIIDQHSKHSNLFKCITIFIIIMCNYYYLLFFNANFSIQIVIVNALLSNLMNYLFSNQSTVTVRKNVTVLEYIFIKHIVYQTILHLSLIHI